MEPSSESPISALVASNSVASAPELVTYGQLMQTHPEYAEFTWAKFRALYKGGPELLNNERVMRDVFPRHRDEIESVYAERCARAFYVNYAAEIIDHLIGSLMLDPLVIESAAAKALPPFYAEFFKDVTRAGGERESLHDFVTRQGREAMITKRAWTLVELPVKRGEYSSVAEQESAGALNAYLIPVQAECVLDWETDDSGALSFAVIHTLHSRRDTVTASRKIVTYRWTVYSGDKWQRYEITPKPGAKLEEKTPVPMVEDGVHSFGRVPLVPLCLPSGLWAMSKLEGPAREHFNKRAALGWGETQSLLPELYEFLGPEVGAPGAVIGAEIQQDAGRAVNQRRGQGHVQTRGADDRAEFIGPSAESFSSARESCKELRDEMHRITHQMALSTDNSAAALGRSGDSKRQDRAATEQVLRAMGNLVREWILRVMDLVATGRKEEILVGKWEAKGLNQFDETETDGLVAQAVDLETVPIPSPTFQRLHRFEIAKAVLGKAATPEVLESIEKELEENVTAEAFEPGANDPPADDEGLGDAQPKGKKPPATAKE